MDVPVGVRVGREGGEGERVGREGGEGERGGREGREGGVGGSSMSAVLVLHSYTHVAMCCPLALASCAVCLSTLWITTVYSVFSGVLRRY